MSVRYNGALRQFQQDLHLAQGLHSVETASIELLDYLSYF